MRCPIPFAAACTVLRVQEHHRGLELMPQRLQKAKAAPRRSWPLPGFTRKAMTFSPFPEPNRFRGCLRQAPAPPHQQFFYRLKYFHGSHIHSHPPPPCPHQNVSSAAIKLSARVIGRHQAVGGGRTAVARQRAGAPGQPISPGCAGNDLQHQSVTAREKASFLPWHYAVSSGSCLTRCAIFIYMPHVTSSRPSRAHDLHRTHAHPCVVWERASLQQPKVARRGKQLHWSQS